METGPSSDDLLGHFDRPKTLELPDFEWSFDAPRDELNGRDAFIERELAVVLPFEPNGPVIREAAVEVPCRRRDVRWVLRYAAAIGVAAIAVCCLTSWERIIVAERRLATAAQAGAMEATLPRATYETVVATIERRLAAYPELRGRLRIGLSQNGSLLQLRLRPNGGDRFGVSLAAPMSSVIPDWLRMVTFWRNDSQIRAYAEQTLPGRRLPARRS